MSHSLREQTESDEMPCPLDPCSRCQLNPTTAANEAPPLMNAQPSGDLPKTCGGEGLVTRIRSRDTNIERRDKKIRRQRNQRVRMLQSTCTKRMEESTTKLQCVLPARVRLSSHLVKSCVLQSKRVHVCVNVCVNVCVCMCA